MRICIQVIFLATICLLIVADTNHYSSQPPTDMINLSGQNFTTYKLDVPGSAPITIIESTTPRRHFYMSPGRIQALRDQNRLDLAKQQQPLQPTAKRSNFTLTSTDKIDDHEDDDEDHDHDHHHHQEMPAKVMRRRNGGERNHPTKHAQLVSRSPQQTQLKAPQANQDVRATIGLRVTANDADDSDTASSSSSDNVLIYKSATERSNYPTTPKDGSNQTKVEYSPYILQNFIKEYTEKLKRVDPNAQSELNKIVRVNSDSTLSNRRYNWNDNRDSAINQENRPNPNPFNDKKGWVTMEAVPWSTSKVSKWHANIDKFGSSSSLNDDDTHEGSQPYQPSWNEYNQNRPHRPSRPPVPPIYDEVLDDDYVYSRPHISSPRPAIYTTYDPYRPQTDRPNFTKPPKFNHPDNSYADSFYDTAERPPTFNPRPHRPSHQSPSAYDYPSNDEDSSSYHDKWYDHGGNKHWNDYLITDSNPADFPKPPERRPTARPHKNQDRYDTTHPDSGNGEWVLISTNKGYQLPSRNGQRAIQMRPSDTPAPVYNDLLSHHTVKLTVLPPLNRTFSSDNRRPSMVLSHGGMLEVESTFNTVEDSVNEANRRNSTAVKAIPKRRVFKGLPIKSRVGAASDTSAVIAAVGAGMVPATMAMLMPMVLGRKKRSSSDLGRKGRGEYEISHTRIDIK